MLGVHTVGVDTVDSSAAHASREGVALAGGDVGLMGIETENGEWVTVRDAMRGLNRLVDELAAGEREKVVLIRHGKMVAVVIPVERFPAPREDDCSRGCCNAGDEGIFSEVIV